MRNMRNAYMRRMMANNGRMIRRPDGSVYDEQNYREEDMRPRQAYNMVYNAYDEMGMYGGMYDGMDDEMDMYDDYGSMGGYKRHDNGRFAPHSEMVGMNPIGFRDTDYTYPHMGGGSKHKMMRGHAASSAKLDKHTAEEWAFQMQNADDTTGPHWTMEQIKKAMQERNIDGDPIEMWAAMNATYSDLCEFFRKNKINTMDAYFDFVKAFWLEDEDAGEGKLLRYYECIVKK